MWTALKTLAFVLVCLVLLTGIFIVIDGMLSTRVSIKMEQIKTMDDKLDRFILETKLP